MNAIDQLAFLIILQYFPNFFQVESPKRWANRLPSRQCLIDTGNLWVIRFLREYELGAIGAGHSELQTVT